MPEHEVQELKPNQDGGMRQVLSVQVDVSVRFLQPSTHLVLAMNSMDVGRREGARGVRSFLREGPSLITKNDKRTENRTKNTSAKKSIPKPDRGPKLIFSPVITQRFQVSKVFTGHWYQENPWACVA